MFALFNMSVLYENRDRIEFPIASRIDVADRKIEEGWRARSQGIELREFESVCEIKMSIKNTLCVWLWGVVKSKKVLSLSVSIHCIRISITSVLFGTV